MYPSWHSYPIFSSKQVLCQSLRRPTRRVVRVADANSNRRTGERRCPRRAGWRQLPSPHVQLPPRLPCRQPRRRAQAHGADCHPRPHAEKDAALTVSTPTPAPGCTGSTATMPTPAARPREACCGWSAAQRRRCLGGRQGGRRRPPLRPPAAARTIWRWSPPSTPRAARASIRARPSSCSTCCATHDRLKLFELHPTDARTLDANIAQLDAGRRIAVLREDGFEARRKFLPPPSRRAPGAVRPELRNQERLCPRARLRRRDAEALRHRHLRGLVSDHSPARGARPAAPAEDAGQPRPASRGCTPR